MRQDVQRGRADEPWIDVAIDGGDDRRDAGISLRQPLKYSPLAHQAVRAQATQEFLRIENPIAMAGQIKRLVAVHQFFQRGQIGSHGAVGRRHQRCRPPHHMIA